MVGSARCTRQTAKQSGATSKRHLLSGLDDVVHEDAERTTLWASGVPVELVVRELSGLLGRCLARNAAEPDRALDAALQVEPGGVGQYYYRFFAL